MTATHRHTNRLAQETSPYLQQHQHNPVDWYPWGPEAFERARAEDKPIFLSVGYSTCYWCHVMERQCFEVEAIAEVMNRHFINIKVDREERPDVDQLYMTAVQVMTRQGGWPMSVWLTPNLKPFYGGTYFPPTDSYGRPGFPRLLEGLADAWRNRRNEVIESADELTQIVARLAVDANQQAAHPITASAISRLVLRSTDDYEPEHGGFGSAPKFPRQTLLSLLLSWLDTEPTPAADRERVRRQLRHTLDSMANGGIRDHLGGGFHRYSTDSQWLVPHFEIMLYDQAMLAPVYARAARIVSDRRYATVARGICDFVLREMTNPAGAFYTAFDAEVDHQEGLNYLWTSREVEDVLGRNDAEVFNKIYGLDRGPNFADPHHGSGVPDKNILFLPDGPDRESDPQIIALRERLLTARTRRKQPLLDTKVIRQWNGLMIAGLAIAARELDEPRYRDAAMRAADAILSGHRNTDGSLVRTSRDGDRRHEATLDDYAALAVALLELHQTTLDGRWQREADAILATADRLFGDAAGGGYFFTASTATDLIVRQKAASDNPLPSGNAQMGLAHLLIGRRDRAQELLNAFGGRLAQYAESMSSMLEVALRLSTPAALTTPPLRADPEVVDPNAVVLLSARRVRERRVDVVARIRPGFHINDVRVSPSSGLHATRLSVGGAAGERVDAIDYPPAPMLQPAFGPPVAGYEGEVLITVRFRDPLPAEPIPLAFSYQPCNESACLPPAIARAEV